MTNFATIQLEQQDNFMILMLNRPESLNSINKLMHQELRQALKIAKTNKSALLLTGNGKGFCSGQDLSDRSSKEKSTESEEKQGGKKPAVDLGDSLEHYYNPLIKGLLNFPYPTVCAVNGVAAGAGVSLSLVCDIVIADENAVFIQAFSKIGLIPDSGLTWILPRLIGNGRALALMLLAEKITAKQAVEWGMIWQTASKEELPVEALKLISKLANMPPQSLKQIRSMLQNTWTNTLNEQLILERDMQSLLGKTEDYQEGVTAFLEKRQPKFTGN